MDFTKQQKLQAKKEELEGEESKKKTQRVPFLKLFCFADSWDYVLMVIASVGACVHGAPVSVFFIFFGKLINIVGVASLVPTQVSNRVAKYALDLVYLAIVILFSSWTEVACWMYTGERQAAKMRLAYLRSLLDQDFTTLQHCLMEPNLILANFEGRHSNSTFVKNAKD